MKLIISESTKALGKASAVHAATLINQAIEEKGYARILLSTGASQFETIQSLIKQPVDWSRVEVFHLDEYVGLSIEREQSFARYLSDHVFSKAPFASVNYIPANGDPDEGCEKYAELLKANKPDVVCMGIGENGHIAFNDPPVADFNDPKLIKKVALDDVCRMQQVHDGCFPTFDDVPKYALTLTVPALMSAEYLICTVPASTKANAVKAMLEGEYGEVCPATALRKHKGAKMFLDKDSAQKVL